MGFGSKSLYIGTLFLADEISTSTSTTDRFFGVEVAVVGGGFGLAGVRGRLEGVALSGTSAAIHSEPSRLRLGPASGEEGRRAIVAAGECGMWVRLTSVELLSWVATSTRRMPGCVRRSWNAI